MQISHWMWVLISNASFSSLWKMIIRIFWALPPTISRKAPFPSKICVPANRRLHGENKLQIYHCSLRYVLTNFKDKRKEFFWGHTEVWSNCYSVSLCKTKNNKLSQFLHIKEVLPIKCQLGNPNPTKHKYKIQEFRSLHLWSPKYVQHTRCSRQPSGVQEENTRT